MDLLRRTPEILRWLGTGCSGPAPNPIKRMVVGSYLRKFPVRHFIETGTYLGDMLAHIARSGVRCTSVELSRDLYEAACRRFRSCGNVRLVHGDSGRRLPELLEEITDPVLFWLDGHYSAGITASAEARTPVRTELKTILRHPVKGHVILIDDARCFDGTDDYPHLDDVLRMIREDGDYRAEVSTDIIHIVPGARS